MIGIVFCLLRDGRGFDLCVLELKAYLWNFLNLLALSENSTKKDNPF